MYTRKISVDNCYLPSFACMEILTSKTQGKNPSPSGVVGHYEDVIVQSFQSLGLKDEYSANYRNSNRSKNQWFSGNSVSDHNDGIWGYRFLAHGGGDNLENRAASVSKPRNYEHSGFLHEARDVPNYHQGFMEIGPSNGPAIDLTRIKDILKGEQCLQKERLIYTLQSFIVVLMIDEHMHSIFHSLLDACELKHLDSLVGMILWESKLFINAAFCKQGVKSIIKLIRRLKKSHHSFTVTRILSTSFVKIMTDHGARQVIQTCFILFGQKPNEILYERTINHCHYLAVHRVDCRSLNDCISTIAGEQRSRLLNNIADIADILCDDPYGNYVLQNILALNNNEINTKIFGCLRGRFVVLAQRKVGSHTVEKCMEISEIWLLPVIEEILNNPQTPRLLAQHLFGNYVIQKALRMTKERGLINHYNSLVNSLEPHVSSLNRTAGGRNVIGVIKE